MFQFDSNLSFYIPVVFPKYANKDFIKEAFEEAHIGMVRRIELSKNGNHYKAYIYFDWVENDMSHGIQNQILGKHKQTFFTFNNKIRNGYWIVKKNVEVLSYNELYKRYNTQRNTISHFLKEIQIKNEQLELKNKKIREKEAEILEKEKEFRLKEIENDNDVDFFETKICQMKQRIEDLETHYYNNYISSDDEEEEEEDESEEIDCYPSESDETEADETETEDEEDDDEADDEEDEAAENEEDDDDEEDEAADASEAENEEVEEAKDEEDKENDVEKNDVEKNDVEVEKNEKYEYDFHYDNDDEFMLI
jgi:hypothetical protein